MIETVPTRSFGARLTALRLNRGWSQSELARRTGLTQRAISYWEDSERLPKADGVARLATAFGMTMDDLWRGR